MSFIMVNNIEYITNNIGKLYISIIMGLFMILLEIMMHDYQYHVFSIKYYLLLIILLGVFTYLYKKQIYINDKEYLKGMLEHHSMALLTSEEILKKTDNYHVAKLSKNIIQEQKDQIKEIKNIIKK
jgi:hypothetical protein